jgi:ribosomal-protein-alanine N-acetyltransferase
MQNVIFSLLGNFPGWRRSNAALPGAGADLPPTASGGTAFTLGRMRTIAAPPCVLEPQLAAHAHEMFAVLSDPAIYEFENAPPIDEEWLRKRYERLESRGSSDGTQQWLNWVIRLQGGKLAGYVQATVLPDRTAYVAYELNSQYWRQGIGSSAVRAVLQELHDQYGIAVVVSVLKAKNYRSEALLRKLGFVQADEEQAARHRDEPDELVMVKAGLAGANAA